MNIRASLRLLGLACLTAAGGASLAARANATPLLVIDAKSGEVLYEREATRPWYPASLTKLVTVYATLKAVREGRVTMDTPFVVSARAARMPPSKMGFRPGQEVTLDNALKMLMVKSANDLAVTIAEGVSGSVEDFAVEMNRVAAELGMRESHFVNPNGLHDTNHYSSARDMAVVARALYRDFPDHADLYGIGALELNGRIIPTHNGIMGRYPGAEGMKTGFVCASGFNVVASATRGGRRLIAVVLGYPNARTRTIKAASLFDEGFSKTSSGPQLAALPAVGGAPPDIRGDVCGRHRKNVTEDDLALVGPASAPGAPSTSDNDSPLAFLLGGGQSSAASPQARAAATTAEQMSVRPYFEPVPVYVGRSPGYTGPVAMARGGEPPAAKPVPAAFAARSTLATGPLAADPKARPLQLGAGATQKPLKLANHEGGEHKAGHAAQAKPEPKGKKVADAKPRPGKKHKHKH